MNRIFRQLLGLDLSICPISPPLPPALPQLPPEIQLDESMLDESLLESEPENSILIPNTILPAVPEEEEGTDGEVSMDVSTDATPVTSASPAPIRLPMLPTTSAIIQSTPTTNSPLRQVEPLPTPPPISAGPVASTSRLPAISISSASPSLPQILKTSLEATIPLSPIVVPEIALDYVNSLPNIPQDLFRQRLVIKRKGKEKDKNAGANGGPDLYRLHVKAQYTGAKNFLGRGKRVHNVLSTADYSVSSICFG